MPEPKVELRRLIAETIREEVEKLDLRRAIIETIRTEIRHEMEGRREMALQHFALTLSADEEGRAN